MPYATKVRRMEFTLSKTELFTRLQIVGRIITPRPTLPILSCFLFEIKDGLLNITAADASGHIRTVMNCFTDIAELRICIEGKMLLDALKILPEQPLTFIINELSVCVKYEGGKYEFQGKETVTFPVVKDIDAIGVIHIKSSSFLKGILKTSFCAANDELRPIMNTIFIESLNGNINYVASDGHRLALLSQKIDVKEKLSFVMPKKMANILKAALPDNNKELSIAISPTKISINFENYSITALQVEGRYPNYRAVIPTNNKKFTIDTDPLRAAISRVAVFSNQVSHLVVFSLQQNNILITGRNIDYSTHAEESIQCEYEDGKLEIAFNSEFFVEILSYINNSQSVVSFSQPSTAVLIKPIKDEEDEELTYLLMPLTINY